MDDRQAQAREALRAAEAHARASSARRAETHGDDGRKGHEDAVREALRFVLRSTQHRPQTEAELAGKLRQRDYSQETVEQTLAAARQQGIVDDAAFAAAWVDDRGIRRGFGPVRLRQELGRRGVAEADIDAALDRLDGRDEHRVALDLARSHARQLAANVGRDAMVRRVGTYLVRRGHPPGLAERVAHDIADETDGG